MSIHNEVSWLFREEGPILRAWPIIRDCAVIYLLWEIAERIPQCLR